MSDFIGDSHRECISHHACDCIQARVERYEKALTELSTTFPDVVTTHRIARAALSQPQTGGEDA